MVGQKNKKKNKRAGSVERALVPSPVFAASPRSATTPAAMPPSTSRHPASSSPLQRGPTPQSPGDEFSEPESSLFDYQHMDEAGYMTVGFGTWPARGRQVHREAERPQSGFRSSGLYAEPGDIQGFEDEDKTVVKMISDIYATPLKKKTSTKSGVDDDKSMTGTQKDVRAEMKRIHDLPPEVNDVMTSSVRQPPNTSYIQPGSSQVPDSGRGSTRPDSLADEDNKPLDHSPNLDYISEQLHSHLVHAGQVETDVESARTVLMQRQVSELKEENEVLKSAVHRLNVELSDFQAKYRHVDTQQLKQIIEVHGLPSSGPVPSWLISKKYLSPLFLAYDDHIDSKNKIIEQCKQECAAIKKRVEEVVRENQTLHAMGRSGRGDTTEWLQLQEQAKLVLEENQVLMEQLEVQILKSKDMYRAQENEIYRMAKKLAVSEGEKVELESQIEKLRVQLQEVRRKHDQLVMEAGSHVNVQTHVNMMSDLKKSVADEKEQAEKELDTVHVKLKASEEERKQQASVMIDLTAENKKLKAEIKATQMSVGRAQDKIALLYKAIELSEDKEMVTQEQLANVIRVAEKTALERDTVYKVAREQQEESKQTVNKMMQGSAAVGKLELKLKLWKMKASARFNMVAEKLVEQEKAFNSQKKEYEREIQHLRSLLKEKEETIESLEKEKRLTETDLDTMWQAATSENKRVKNILLSGSRKLRDQAHIAEALQQEMENEELLHFFDDSKGS